MQFDYFYTQTAVGTIQIEDIGNSILQAINNKNEEYFLIIKTIDGMSHIIEYGPNLIDVNELCSSVIYKYNRIEYNERKLIRIIDSFINNAYREITQVTELKDIAQVKSAIKDFLLVIS